MTLSSARTERAPIRTLSAGVQTAVEAAMATVLIATLALYAALGTFTRYVADDYAQLVAVRLRGFWGEQFAEYRLWSGRFTSTALVDAAASLNQAFVCVLPGTLLTAWALLIYWVSGTVARGAGRTGRVLLAAGLVFTTIQVTPQPFLSLYWMTGSLTYITPLLLGTALTALVVAHDRHSPRYLWIGLAIAGLAFVAGGTNETYLAAQTAALLIAMAVAASPWVPIARPKLAACASGVLGSLIAGAVVFAAPGNAIRIAAISSVVKDRPSLIALPGLAISFAGAFFQAVFATHWLSLLAVAAIGGLVGMRSHVIVGRHAAKHVCIAMTAVAIAAFVVVACAIAPSALEEARLTDAYAQVTLVYICVAAAAVLGWLGAQVALVLAIRFRDGHRTPRRFRRLTAASLMTIVAAGVIAGPIIDARNINGSLPAIERYASTKDNEASAALAAYSAGRDSATVARLPAVDGIGIFSHPTDEDLTDDPSFWINRDEARYFGLDSLAAAP